jgi:FKBP-type peptidyl-prolyl cis-trans isomerase SlyD
MRIDRGKVVTLAFELRNAQGDSLEDADAQLSYCTGGFGGIFPKVEEVLGARSAPPR